MAEIKRIASEMGIKSIMFPDTSGVVNSPLDGKFHMYPKGGATMDEIRMRRGQHLHARPGKNGIDCGS